MKKKLLFLALLISLMSFFGQRPDTIYYNRNWTKTTKELAGYYRIKTKVNKADTLYWEFTDFYIDNNQTQNHGYFTKEHLEVRQGYWTWYHQNGNLKMEGNYQNGKPNGEWKHYHTNGALQKIGKYEGQGKQDGLWTWFYEDSTLKGTTLYRKDTLVGERKWYHQNGQQRLQEYFKDGKLDSIRSEWHSTGQLKSIVPYSGGFKHGEEKNYYTNGQLKSSIRYTIGIPSEDKWFSMLGEPVPKDEVVSEKEDHNLLWKISGNGLKKPSYLFGTMHVKNKEAFEFSDSMLLAFNSAEGYSMEIHPDSLYAYTFKQFDKYKSYNYFGSEVIGQDDPYSWFTYWDKDYGSYNQWILNLNQIFHRDTQEPDGMPYFVDCYLYYIARKQGKFTDGIETVEDHVSAGKNLPANTKKYDILTKFNPAQEMMDTYHGGNLDQINALMEYLQNDEFRYRLLTLRNIKMANAIDSLVQIRPTFNTAGTAHLPAHDGVIELLRQKGYTLTAVKAVFSGDSLDASVNDFNLDWKRVRPFGTHFSVETPGRFTAFNDGVIRSVYLDPIREIGFDAYELDERFYVTGSKSKKITQADVYYLLDNNAQVTSKKQITHKGKKALEVYYQEGIASNRAYFRGGISSAKDGFIYTRMRMFKNGYTTKVVTVASTSKDSLENPYALRYLQSIDWLPETQNQSQEWSTFLDTTGAFRAESPTNRSYRFLNYTKDQSTYFSNEKSHHVNYWTSQDNGDVFSFRYSNSPKGYSFFKDRVVFGEALSFYDAFLEKPDTTFFDFEGYPAMDVTYKPNKDHLLKLRFINRGYRHYLLVAQIKNQKESLAKASRFLDSFHFNPLQSQPMLPYRVKPEGVELLLPKGVVQKTNASSRFFVEDRKLTLDQGYGTRESYRSDAFERDWEETSRNTQSAGAYLNRDKVYALDTVAGVTYQAYLEVFSKDYYLPNRDSLFTYYARHFTNQTDSVLSEVWDSTQQDQSMIYTKHRTFKRTQQNGEGQIRFTHKGQLMMIQRVFYPLEMAQSPAIRAFFEGVDCSSIKDTVNLFEDKSVLILEGLTHPDSLVQVAAGQALRFYPFEGKHLASIQQYTLREADLDTNDLVNHTEELLVLQRHLKDSSTLGFYQDFYEQYTPDSLPYRFALLKLMRQLPDPDRYQKTFEFINQVPLRFGEYPWDYTEILTSMDDTLQGFATHFGAFENWMNDTLWSFETRILAKANQAMAIDSIDQIGIFNQADFLKQKYKWVYAVFGALESDTSIYGEVREQLIELTDLVSQLGQDQEMSQLFFQLKDHKNKQVRQAATKALFRNPSAMTKLDAVDLLADLKHRYGLMLLLESTKQAGLIPERYRKDQKELLKAQLFYALTTEDQHDQEPVKMKLEKIIKKKIEGQTMEFYVFSYYREGYTRRKKIGVSHPISIKDNAPVLVESPMYVEADFNARTLKSDMSVLVEDWIQTQQDQQNQEKEEQGWSTAIEAAY